MSSKVEEYLGDSVYASFDGWQFCLRAPREGGDHVVYLEPAVLAAFARFCKRCQDDTELPTPSRASHMS